MMPCESEGYPTVTEANKQNQRVAKLLVYVCHKLGRAVTQPVKRAANDKFCKLDLTPALCEMLTSLDEAVRDEMVYNAKDRTARDLADWWEDHLASDERREKLEKEAANKKALVRTALSKLTEEELKVLDLDTTLGDL